MDQTDQQPRQGIGFALPDSFCFRLSLGSQNIINPAMQSNDLRGGTPIYTHHEYPESGGILRYAEGFLHPEWGLPFPAALYGINHMKRDAKAEANFLSRHPVVALLTMRKKALADLLTKYGDKADVMLQHYYYEDKYYMPFASELRKLVFTMLKGMSSKEASEKTALVVATIFEHDNAWRYRFQDIFMETTKEKLMSDFPNEIVRILTIMASREVETRFNQEAWDKDKVMMYNDTGTLDIETHKLAGLKKLVKVLWLVPRFRRAVRSALSVVDWNKLLPDEHDRYHCLIRHDYRHFGRTIEDRWKEWLEIHKGNPPKLMYVVDRIVAS